MPELLLSLLVFCLAAAGLGIGVLRGRSGIEGSCGGLNRIPGIKSDCGGVCRRHCRQRRSKPGTQHSGNNEA